MPSTIARWQLLDQKIIFTNGCFDLLHYGHLHYLVQAKSLGDKLIIGLNSHKSVKRLKGQHRPINDDLTRFYLLASLVFVDAVIEFSEDTPLELIKKVQPDILVKGGDWLPEQIVGADFVLKRGGKVKSLPYIKGYSTTNIEAKIKNR
ncbi:MAG: D-glycero-beta-D-manno-heptose 1-phosphate adenylyltransferase, partial [Bacteroidota bacterium]